MKVLAYIPILYGEEYLDACIKSIDDHVEKIVILYTDRPSYGHFSQAQCPETEDQLKEIASQIK